MSVKSRFCKPLSKLKEEEMQNFVKYFEARKMDQASRALESLGSINEMTEDICEIRNKQ